MITSTLEQMVTHLRFLGYEISREGVLTAARHPRKPNVLMRPLAGGVLFTAIFRCRANAKRNKLGYLKMINSLNAEAAIARFYADKDFDLVIEAWHPDYYDRTDFGAFMETWDRDCSLLLANLEAATYLK